MKRFFYILTFMFLGVFLSNAQNDSVYYYYQGKKVAVEQHSDKLCVLLNEDAEIPQSVLNRFQLHFSNIQDTHHKFYILESNSGSSLQDAFQYLKSQSYISEVGFLLEYHQILACVNSTFLVKLKQKDLFSQFQSLLREHNCYIEDTLSYMDNGYLLNSNNSSKDVFELSNFFYETNLFEFAHPNFINLNTALSVDPYYDQQWGVSSNYTLGDTIGVEKAWTITTGEYVWDGLSQWVKVAILDDGFDFNHPDLSGNVAYLSYGDHADNPESKHGTACAGIIGAKRNNSKGVSGVVPQCALISVYSNAIDVNIANAIKWVCDKKADVLSISQHFYPTNNISEAIRYAITHGGRGGEKGVVVVCAAGNSNDNEVEFPANLSTQYGNVIAVGAVDSCGYRAGRKGSGHNYAPDTCDPWDGEKASNYGTGLSVVAPGSHVLTTDCQGDLGYNPLFTIPDHPDKNYTYFKGTSAACPFVAGVAALVISARPQYRASDVKSIIEQTAIKYNNQHYHYNTIKDNGWWNEQLGYGLVNAYTAVKNATKVDLYVRDTISDYGETPSHVTYMWDSPDIWIEDMQHHRVDNPRSGERYNVCVKIRNADVVPSNGKQKLLLNWSKAGVNMPWPSGWEGSIVYSADGHSVPMSGFVGDTIIPSCTLSNSTVDCPTTVKIPWLVPEAEDYNFGIFQNSEEKWHFCLLARIHDGNDIIGENQQNYPIDQFVLNNNNVAWKNISVMKEEPAALIWMSNRKPEKHLYDFDIALHKNTSDKSILDYGEFYVRLNPSLVEDWQNGGSKSSGLRYIGDNCFRVLDEKASLNNVEIPAGEFGWIESIVKFYTKQNVRNRTFTFDIAMRDDKELYGGEHYEVIYNDNRNFQAVAPEDLIAIPLDEISLNARDVSEPANYMWYDEQGDTVAVGITLTTIATKNQRYKLEVESTVDGYKSCDSVNVKLKKGIITTMSPNPAETQVTVAYRLAPTVTGGTVQLTNMMGMVVKSEPFSQASTSVNINVNDLIYGQYTVKLVDSNGEVLDSKVLIVR